MDFWTLVALAVVSLLALALVLHLTRPRVK